MSYGKMKNQVELFFPFGYNTFLIPVKKGGLNERRVENYNSRIV